MGQVALGFQNLLIKLAVFVVLAALLAWALGGTLFPRPEIATFDSVSFSGGRWFWRLSVGGRNDGEVRWDLMIDTGDEKPQPLDGRHWAEVAGPIVAGDRLYFAARASMNAAEPWRIECVDEGRKITAFSMPDRLAVELQLARLAAGLELQDMETIRRERERVLDPTSDSAEEETLSGK
jgi:hypothetical protein